MEHRWHFFRAGGVDQVCLRDGYDLLALASSIRSCGSRSRCRRKGVDLDPSTLDLLDTNKDGRIRVQDMLAASRRVHRGDVQEPDDVLAERATTSSSPIARTTRSSPRRSACSRTSARPTRRAISIADATRSPKAFADTVLNGDGIVIPGVGRRRRAREADRGRDRRASAASPIAAASPASTRRWPTRSSPTSTSAPRGSRSGKADGLLPLGDATAAAAAALAAVKAKIEDYFTRCRLAAFDPRAQPRSPARTPSSSRSRDARARPPATTRSRSCRSRRSTPPRGCRCAPALNPAWAARHRGVRRAGRDADRSARATRSRPPTSRRSPTKLAPYRGVARREAASKVDRLDDAWLAKLARARAAREARRR